MRPWERSRRWSPLLSLLFLIDMGRFELEVNSLVDIAMEIIILGTFIATVALVIYS